MADYLNLWQKRWIVSLLISLILILVVTGLKADELEREPNVLVFTQSESEDIIGKTNQTASEMLKEFNLNAIQIEDSISIDDLLEKAGWLGAFFVIETNYSQSEGFFFCK